VVLVNLVIGGINALIKHFATGIVNGINKTIGVLFDFTLDMPNIPQIPTIKALPDVPFANGGVVTGPTRALIGEAGRAEMVMPLDNSPQMQQFISQIADAVRGNNAQPMEVHVYLDSRAIASGMYDELHNVEFRRGASLIS
jgi:SLT domain-containing protein